MGIGCEQCHGPMKDHVDWSEAHPQEEQEDEEIEEAEEEIDLESIMEEDLRVEINDNRHTASQYDAAWVMTETTENPNGDRGEVGYWSTTLGKLNDGLATDLDDTSHGPIGPGDLTWAFQWDRTIGVDDTFQISKDKQIRTFVPEPVTMAGLLLGIGALGGYIRRRRA